MEPTALTIDLRDHEPVQARRPVGLADEVRQRHQRLEPHLDFLTRLASRLDDHDEQALRSLLVAGLNCTDDDVLPYLEESTSRLYPAMGPRSGLATQLMATQHRAVGRIRHGLRDLAVGDLDLQPRREAVRQRLYELTALLRSLLTQEVEVCLPLLDSPDPTPR